jgi:hypothetical protein
MRKTSPLRRSIVIWQDTKWEIEPKTKCGPSQPALEQQLIHNMYVASQLCSIFKNTPIEASRLLVFANRPFSPAFQLTTGVRISWRRIGNCFTSEKGMRCAPAFCSKSAGKRSMNTGPGTRKSGRRCWRRSVNPAGEITLFFCAPTGWWSAIVRPTTSTGAAQP